LLNPIVKLSLNRSGPIPQTWRKKRYFADKSGKKAAIFS
jgi:hypothetical protein